MQALYILGLNEPAVLNVEQYVCVAALTPDKLITRMMATIRRC